VLYAWQRKRAFQEYNRFMAWLKAKRGCLHCLLYPFLTCFGKCFGCTLRCIDRCWLRVYTKIEEKATVKCPKRWDSTKKCCAHVMGTCFYASERVVANVDEAVDSETAERLANGRAPEALRVQAKALFFTWKAAEGTAIPELDKPVECLSLTTKHVDGWRPPFRELRLLVCEELVKQITATLETTTTDFANEASYFLNKKEINLGKEQKDESEFERATFFKGAGQMETVSTLLSMLEKAGCSVTKSQACKKLRPVLNKAAVVRLKWASDKKDYRPLQYALFCAGRLHALNLTEAKAAGREYKVLRGLPEDWDVLKMASEGQFGFRMLAKKDLGGSLMGLKPVPGSLADTIQKIMDETFIAKFTRDRKDGDVPSRLVLVGATHVQNEQNWVEYAARRADVAKELATSPLKDTEKFRPRTFDCQSINKLPTLDSSMQEAWMWHGTSSAGSDGITNTDFRINLSGSNAGTLYGRGVYLAEACSKSDEYTADEQGNRYLLLCRVTLGRIYYTAEVRPDTKNLEDLCTNGQYHSVLGDREAARGTFREFISYDDDLVYPAYIIRYRRQFYKT